MVLIFRGRTKCGLCGKTIEEDDDVVGFPAFLKFTHPLGRFSDAAFHKACFENCPDRDAAEAVYQKYRAIWESRPRNLKTLEEMEAWGKEAFKDFE